MLTKYVMSCVCCFIKGGDEGGEIDEFVDRFRPSNMYGVDIFRTGATSEMALSVF